MKQQSSTLLSVAALVVVLAAIRSAPDLVLPFLLAVFISIIANAPISWLGRRGVPGGLSIIIVIVVLILLLFGTTMVLTASIQDFSDNLPVYQTGLQNSMSDIRPELARVGIDIPENGIRNLINPPLAMSLANSLLAGITQLLSNAILIAMFVILMLLEASDLSEKIDVIRRDEGQSRANIARFVKNTNQYMAMKSAICLAEGILITFGMMMLGVNNAILWGFLTFLLNFIPTIGLILAAIPPILLAWLQLGPRSALYAALCFLAVNIVVGNIIEPRVMGRGMGLSTLVIFLSLVFWGWLLGPVGMVLSVPLTMLAKFWAETDENTRWIAVLLSSGSDVKTLSHSNVGT
jgi:predicted PurR-regulated permease PerM